MKKFLAALLGMTLLFVAGCGANPEAEAVKTTAEAFLKSQQAGDLDESAKYMTESAVRDMGTMEELRDSLSAYEAMGISGETMDTFMDSMLKAYGMVWEKYEIGDVKVDGDTATVMVKVTGIPMDTLENEMTEEYGSELAQQWVVDHSEEIQKYMEDHTEEESFAWLMDQILPDAGKQVEAKMADAERKTSDYRLTLEKDGDDWKVSNVEVKADK
ncbi:hypothetical protein [uncultured Faecalibaculum sp.]|uniref:hypothetical protein n=2 Tax=uncultured Faecalibaculum sp. TaxID=1729681 RepID=UPI0025EE4567|nr:hypothetical protein [uncultured Faecalibaculum sp.]